MFKPVTYEKKHWMDNNKKSWQSKKHSKSYSSYHFFENADNSLLLPSFEEFSIYNIYKRRIIRYKLGKLRLTLYRLGCVR